MRRERQCDSYSRNLRQRLLDLWRVPMYAADAIGPEALVHFTEVIVQSKLGAASARNA